MKNLALHQGINGKAKFVALVGKVTVSYMRLQLAKRTSSK